jgi:tol-pal system protein YbgF
MIQRSDPRNATARLMAVFAAAGLLFVLPASAQTQLPPPAFGQADMRQDRIEELEGQLRDSEAEKEELQRRLNEANRELARLRAMVGELAGVNQSLSTPPADGAPGPAAITPPPSQDRRSEADGLNDAQRAQVGTLGTIPADAAPAPPTDPAAAYAQAGRLLNAGRYAEAEIAYQQFIEQFPNATEAGIARFWLAYTQAARNNHRDAASNFVAYLQRTPNGSRAAEAQVRLGMALLGMGERQQGCSAITSMARRYPNAPANARDLAAREARAANCSA